MRIHFEKDCNRNFLDNFNVNDYHNMMIDQLAAADSKKKYDQNQVIDAVDSYHFFLVNKITEQLAKNQLRDPNPNLKTTIQFNLELREIGETVIDKAHLEEQMQLSFLPLTCAEPQPMKELFDLAGPEGFKFPNLTGSRSNSLSV